MSKSYPTDQRRRDLAAIHTAKRDLALDDDTYRDVLWTVARVRSAGDLDQAGRSKVLDHLRARGWAPSTSGRGRGVAAMTRRGGASGAGMAASHPLPQSAGFASNVSRDVRENPWAFIDKAAADKQPLLRKICAVCRSMGVGKAYAEGAAKRQTGIERKLEMMDQGQLWLLAGVLERTRKSKESAK